MGIVDGILGCFAEIDGVSLPGVSVGFLDKLGIFDGILFSIS